MRRTSFERNSRGVGVWGGDQDLSYFTPVSHRHTHTHTKPLIVHQKLSQSKGEKKAPIYLNQLSVKNEGSTPPFFFFFYCPFTPSPPNTDRPIVREDKGQEREQERWGEGSSWRGWYSPDKRMNDPVHCGMRRRKQEGLWASPSKHCF